MRVHRFFTGDKITLKQNFWLRDEAIIWQWTKVLRFRAGQEVILFDGERIDRLYRVTELNKNEAHLELVTELDRQLPKNHIYLFWSLLKKDNNDHVLQKCTEIGVSNFVPITSERSIRDNFNIDRAHKIVQEASEQCGRSNIPMVREPITLQEALKEYEGVLELYICEKGGNFHPPEMDIDKKYGIFIGPEGGWSNTEKQFFADKKIPHLHINDFILRAETAAVVAVSKLS